jgi:type VI secretion system secreted protein VgrG
MTTPSPAMPQTLELVLDSNEAFDVRTFAVNEGVNTLFSIELIVRCRNPAVDLDRTVGAEASFRIGLEADADSLAWTGVIADIEQVLVEESGLSTYQLRLVPALWLLTQRTNHRVFQQMTDLEVVRAMLTDWRLPHESRCRDSYKPRKYRVQHQETDFAFVSRLLEDSGVSFFLEQREGGTIIVLHDAPEAAEPRATPLEHVNDITVGPKVWATGLRAERGVRQGRTTFADHDPRLANQPLLAQASSSGHPLESRLESFAYQPGAFKFGNAGPNDTPTADDRGRSRTDPDEGRLIAERDAAVRVALSQRFSFMSNCLELRAGTVLSLSNHPLFTAEGGAPNGAERLEKILLTQVIFTGTSESEVRVSAEAVRGDVPHEPERKTPRPKITGVECATVVGPEGETIHCDEFGRVRVQFHWDRYGSMDELSSCWTPVSQAWAGEGFGMVDLPRIGQEVLVSFLGGNPEEPVIVGRVFTNLQRPPFALPEAKNESGFRSKSVPETGGYNLLRYVDTAGSELVQGRAEKDMYSRVNHDKELSVGHDRRMSIENDDEERVARDQREWVGKDKNVHVAKNYTSIVGNDRTLKTDQGMTSQAKSHFVVAEESLLISVGKSFIYMDKDLIHVSSPLIKFDEKDPRRNHRDSGGIWANGANYSGGAKLPLPDEGK